MNPACGCAFSHRRDVAGANIGAHLWRGPSTIGPSRVAHPSQLLFFLHFFTTTMPLSPYLASVPLVGANVFIHESAQVIGDVTLGPDSSVWCNAVLRGDVNRIVVGAFSNVQDLTMGHVSHRNPAKPEGSPLVIGDYVTVGHSVILHGCRIGNECLIGMGSIVMDDAVVEDRVMLGAGSLVSPGKVLESGYLYIGRPAVRQRALTGAEIAYLKYSAEHYVRVKNNYLAGEPAGAAADPAPPAHQG